MSSDSGFSEAETVIVEDYAHEQPVRLKKLKRLCRKLIVSSDAEDSDSDCASVQKKNPQAVSPSNQKASPTTSVNYVKGIPVTLTKRSSSGEEPGVRANTAAGNSRKGFRVGRDANGRLLLQRLCDRGALEQVQSLAMDALDVNDQDYAGNTGLHEAALKGHVKLVEYLLDHNAKIDIQSGPGVLETPLMDAVSNGWVETVRLLLARGADPRIKNAQGKTALDLLDRDSESSEEISSLLSATLSSLGWKNKSSDPLPATPRKNGVDQNKMSADSELTDEFATMAQNRRRKGARSHVSRNDLMWMDLTTKSGREQIYQKAADGDLEFVGSFLGQGWKPDGDCLCLAAKHGHTEVIGLLLAFDADVNALDEKGETALLQTAGRGHLDTVRFLLDAGADPTLKNAAGKNALELSLEALAVDREEVSLLEAATKLFKGTTSSATINSTNNLRTENKPEARYTADLKGSNSGQVKANDSGSTKIIQEQGSSKAGQTTKGGTSGSLARSDTNSGQKVSSTVKVESPPEPSLTKDSMKPRSNSTLTGVPTKEPASSKRRMPSPPIETQKKQKARLISSPSVKDRDQKLRDREALEQHKVQQRKAREKRMLEQLEIDEKKKLEKSETETARDASSEIDKTAQKNGDVDSRQAEMKTNTGIWADTQPKDDENLPSGLKSIVRDSPHESTPLIVVTKADRCFFVDVQIMIVLGLDNTSDALAEISKEPIMGNTKLKLWSVLMPLISPISMPGVEESVDAVIARRESDFEKYLELPINWLDSVEVRELVSMRYSALSITFENDNCIHVDIECHVENKDHVARSPPIQSVKSQDKWGQLPLWLQLKMKNTRRFP